MKILISTLIGWFLYSVTAYAQSDKEEFMPNVPDYLEYAKLSEAVYLDEKNVDGWQRIKDKRDPLSGFHGSIYQKGDELVVVFEGTQSVADIAANAPFINSEQAVQALEFSRFLTDRQQDFGGKQKITFTGHSLGGELAMIAGILYRDASIVTFNTSGITEATRDSLGEKNIKNADITNICLEGDVVCSGKKPGKNIILNLSTVVGIPRLIGNHSISDVVAVLDLVNVYQKYEPQKLSSHSADNTLTLSIDTGLSLIDKGVVKARDIATKAKAVTLNVAEAVKRNIANARRLLALSLQNRLTAYVNGGNSVIGAASLYITGTPIRREDDSQQRVYDNTNTRPNVREIVNTDGVIIETPVDILLSWGDRPRDLDSHLTVPLADGNRFQVSFFARGNLDSSPNALLHTDYINHEVGGSNLPEQTRINEFRDGIYRFYVHDFSNRNENNSDALANSGASVSIFHGGTLNDAEGQGIGTNRLLQVDVPDSRGNTWHAFDLDPRTTTITTRDEFRDINSANEVPFND